MKKDLKEKVIVFSDLDGTALKSNNEFSDNLINTAKALHENGHQLITITARSTYDGIFRQAKKLGLDTTGGIAVANNGTHIYNFSTNKYLREEYIGNEMLKKVFDKTYGKIGKYKVHYFSNEATYVYGDGENSRHWSDVMQVEYVVITSFEDIRNKISHLTIILDNNASEKEKLEFYKEFEFVDNELSIAQYTSRVFDLSPKGIDKGEAIQFILKHFGWNETNTSTFCFGDSFNDVPMFKVAQYPVAMGNAIDKLKELAKYNTLSNDEDGVSKFINENIL
ncbi:HAD superfamily hydrolase [Spiroplasma helicoides]|uniref:HAD superfamily hydrolase n=1 Tax=Spiroplasma helicoides TaxID=216938 RepID=A0A1B3SJJ3_9MOLU|nr:Cof-type HAD-IIB family hydrolase [Spiroplasma helicoides]AOG60090.1 HAD superfamily hydrolase [Spiroplasma helicoides]